MLETLHYLLKMSLEILKNHEVHQIFLLVYFLVLNISGLIFETPYCLANSLMLLFAHNFFFCCQSTGAIFQDNAIKRDIAAILSQHFGDDIDCDSINESTQFRFKTKTRQRNIKFNEDLLDNFIGFKFISNQLIAEIGNNFLIFFNNNSKLFFVSI